MNKQLITIDGKDYWFKIGLRGIMYLQSLTKYDESDLIVAGLITPEENHLNATISKQLYYKNSQHFHFLFSSLSLFEQDFSFFSYDIPGLYSRAVGEIGIDPSIVLQMTPQEIELAYKGYQRRQEALANIIKLAVIESLDNNQEIIQLIEPDEFCNGNQLERSQVCEVLLNG